MLVCKQHVLLVVLFLPAVSSSGSNSLALLSVYIKGQTPFPEFSFTLMLDDLTVGYYDSETQAFVSRSYNGIATEDVVDPDHVKTISAFMHADLEKRWLYIKYDLNLTENIYFQQRIVLCELMDKDAPGQMITKSASQGSTVDELHFHEGKFTYHGAFFTEEQLKPHLDISLWRYERIYYPVCIKTLRGYLKKRSNQVKRKVKPRVRLIQRTHSVSGWAGVTCLATGFYPRHINLTLLKDGQPVAEHLLTGGDLLPNADRTYQMQKSLELREEELKQEHKFTCTASHLSLDNKLDVHLDYDGGELTMTLFTSVLTVVVLVCGMICLIIICQCCKKKCTASD